VPAGIITGQEPDAFMEYSLGLTLKGILETITSSNPEPPIPISIRKLPLLWAVFVINPIETINPCKSIAVDVENTCQAPFVFIVEPGSTWVPPLSPVLAPIVTDDWCIEGVL
jgi:hypothetical protein